MITKAQFIIIAPKEVCKGRWPLEGSKSNGVHSSIVARQNTTSLVAKVLPPARWQKVYVSNWKRIAVFLLRWPVQAVLGGERMIKELPSSG